VNKIPVWRTIGRAYGFTFGNLATIIGLIWLPLAMLLVGGYFTISHYFDGVLTAIASGNRYAAYSGAGYFYLYRIAGLLLEAVITVSVMRLALGLRDKPVFVDFRLWLTELRMFVAFVALSLVLVAVEVAGFIVALIAGVALGLTLRFTGPIGGVPVQTIAIWGVLALLVAFAGMLVFVAIRLSFFVVAVTVSENRIDLIRAWELTRGNFWRTFFVTVCVGLPTWILYVGVQLAVIGFVAGDATSISPMSIQLSGSAAAVAARMHQMLAWLPYLYGTWFLIHPLVLGLTSGAAAAAYRALVPAAPAVSTPPADVPATIG
jgi:hypothetical protein